MNDRRSLNISQVVEMSRLAEMATEGRSRVEEKELEFRGLQLT